ncbi:MAG: glycosyltransferase family 2 protein [Clostridiales bacterium]|nr:glycosyltransferase family 2 protein [Clostridiales bacterium]
MKLISILIPCLNEVDNVQLIADAIDQFFQEELSGYRYELLFIDNFSTDGTRDKLRLLCNDNKNVKAILNVKNFGPLKSPVYGMIQTSGDCTIQMAADFQDPIECIPELIKKWEEGFKVVIGKKTNSKENPLMYFCRSTFYKIFNKIGDIEHIEHFTGFGLYDKSFIEMLRKLDDPIPYLRGIVTELGPKRAEVEFVQPRRQHGKTKTNFFSLYDVAMLGITSYSKVIPRIATFAGFITGGLCLVGALTFFIIKLLNWETFPWGMAPMLISLFFLSGIQLFFIGFLGECVNSINVRVMNRPLVVEDERLNFEGKKE